MEDVICLNTHTFIEPETFNHLDDFKDTGPCTNNQGILQDFDFEDIRNVEVIDKFEEFQKPQLEECPKPPKEDMITSLKEFNSNNLKSNKEFDYTKKKKKQAQSFFEKRKSSPLSNSQKIEIIVNYNDISNNITKGENENLGILRFNKFNPPFKVIIDANFQFREPPPILMENQVSIKRNKLLFTTIRFSKRKRRKKFEN